MICVKDNLARIFKKNKQLFGNVYNFTPLTFILPNEYRQIIAYQNKEGNENTIWICKPTDSCRGQGISLIKKIDDLKYDQ